MFRLDLLALPTVVVQKLLDEKIYNISDFTREELQQQQERYINSIQPKTTGPLDEKVFTQQKLNEIKHYRDGWKAQSIDLLPLHAKIVQKLIDSKICEVGEFTALEILEMVTSSTTEGSSSSHSNLEAFKKARDDAKRNNSKIPELPQEVVKALLDKNIMALNEFTPNELKPMFEDLVQDEANLDTSEKMQTLKTIVKESQNTLKLPVNVLKKMFAAKVTTVEELSTAEITDLFFDSMPEQVSSDDLSWLKGQFIQDEIGQAPKKIQVSEAPSSFFSFTSNGSSLNVRVGTDDIKVSIDTNSNAIVYDRDWTLDGNVSNTSRVVFKNNKNSSNTRIWQRCETTPAKSLNTLKIDDFRQAVEGTFFSEAEGANHAAFYIDVAAVEGTGHNGAKTERYFRADTNYTDSESNISENFNKVQITLNNRNGQITSTKFRNLELLQSESNANKLVWCGRTPSENCTWTRVQKPRSRDHGLGGEGLYRLLTDPQQQNKLQVSALLPSEQQEIANFYKHSSSEMPQKLSEAVLMELVGFDLLKTRDVAKADIIRVGKYLENERKPLAEKVWIQRLNPKEKEIFVKVIT